MTRTVEKGATILAITSHVTLPEPAKSTIVEPNATRTLFVGNLEADITEKELRDLFGPYGRIEAIDIKTQRSTATAYAFVKFVTINDAINAKSDMHSRQYGNFRLKIGFGKGSPTAKICLDAAQTAVNSLTGYRFKTTNLPLKIDLSRFNHVRSDFDDADVVMDWQERGPQSSHDKRPALSDDLSYKKKLREREARFRGETNGKQTPPPMSSHYRSNKQEDRSDDVQGRGEEFERPIHRKRPRTPPTLPPPPEDHHEGVRKHRLSSIDSQNGDHTYRSKRPKGSSGEERERSSRGDHVNPDKPRLSSSVEPKSSSPVQRRTSEAGENRKPVDKPKASDTALKLSDTTEPISPDSEKSVKPDSGSPESLSDLAKLYPVAWRGNLVLKNTGFPTRMHLVGGDPAVAEILLRGKDGGSKEDSCPGGHCIMLALPGPTPTNQASPPEHNGDMQLRPLRSLVSYLKQKEAAGIVALSPNEAGADLMAEKDLSKDVIGVLHAFPPCLFSQQQLLKIAPNLGSEPSKEDHIVVLLVKGTV
eukprot:Em0014g36a